VLAIVPTKVRGPNDARGPGRGREYPGTADAGEGSDRFAIHPIVCGGLVRPLAQPLMSSFDTAKIVIRDYPSERNGSPKLDRAKRETV